LDNITRLKMAIDGVEIIDANLLIYLEENTLVSTAEYVPASGSNKKQIYKTALTILEEIANSPSTMKNYKNDDISITNFAENLQSRIDQLEKKIRQISSDDTVSTNDSGASFVYMFK